MSSFVLNHFCAFYKKSDEVVRVRIKIESYWHDIIGFPDFRDKSELARIVQQILIKMPPTAGPRILKKTFNKEIWFGVSQNIHR